MSDEEVVVEDNTFWWSNWIRVENLELIFSLISIGIVIFVIQEDLMNSNPTLFWIVAILDLAIVGFFVAELAKDLSLTEDRSEWWRAQSWGLLGLTPVILAAIPQISVIVLFRLVHLTKVYSLATNLLGLQEGLASSLEDRLSNLKRINGVHLHWYQKGKEIPGRKLGHVPLLLYAEDAELRKKEALEGLKNIRSIWPNIWAERV